MAAFRYKKFLSDESHQMLFATHLDGKNNGTAPIGWNSAKKQLGDEYMFAKAGGQTGVAAWVIHLPWGVDAYFVTNSNDCNGCGNGPGKGISDAIVDGFMNGVALE
jgi:hypothetical protein